MVGKEISRTAGRLGTWCRHGLLPNQYKNSCVFVSFFLTLLISAVHFNFCCYFWLSFFFCASGNEDVFSSHVFYFFLFLMTFFFQMFVKLNFICCIFLLEISFGCVLYRNLLSTWLNLQEVSTPVPKFTRELSTQSSDFNILSSLNSQVNKPILVVWWLA